HHLIRPNLPATPIGGGMYHLLRLAEGFYLLHFGWRQGGDRLSNDHDVVLVRQFRQPDVQILADLLREDSRRATYTNPVGPADVSECFLSNPADFRTSLERQLLEIRSSDPGIRSQFLQYFNQCLLLFGAAGTAKGPCQRWNCWSSGIAHA